jgi:hypothetical protein
MSYTRTNPKTDINSDPDNLEFSQFFRISLFILEELFRNVDNFKHLEAAAIKLRSGRN